MTTRTIDHHIGTLAYSVDHESCSAPPLVMLHGLGDSAIETFAPLFRHAPLVRPTIAIDLPGHGQSTWNHDAIVTVESTADAIADMLDSLGIPHVAMLGHSLGGNVAIALAARHPHRVSALVIAEALLDPSHSRLAQSLSRRTAREFSERGYGHLLHATARQAARGDIAAAAFKSPVRKVDPAAMHALACSLVDERDPSFADLLAGLDVPVTFLLGGRTTVSLERLPGGVILERIPDAGHAMMSEQPEAFVDAVVRAVR